MPLVNLDIAPGIYKEASTRSARPQWADGDKVRFHSGFAEKIGGWDRFVSDALDGAAHGAWAWSTIARKKYAAFGTNDKLWLWSENDTALFNITPIRATASLTDPFATTSGSTTVTVTDEGHGAIAGDWVTISNASAVGGLSMNGDWQVATIVDVDTYTIEHTSAAASTATGGGTAQVDYEIQHFTEASSTTSTGWGEGGFGQGPFGGSVVASTHVTGRIWFLENWGDDLIANYFGGQYYLWDESSGTDTRAALIEEAPTFGRGFMISPTSRQLITMGAHDGSADDPMLLRWCDEEDLSTWTSTSQNAAGDIRLEIGTEIIGGKFTRGGALVLTDLAAYFLQHIGGQFIFRLDLVGTNCGLVGPHAITDFSGTLYFMGPNNFFSFSGQVDVLPCDVQSFVFNGMTLSAKSKVWAGTNREFNEVIWLYPADGADEPNRYVSYCRTNNTWSIGTLERTVWLDRNPLTNNPLAIDHDGVMYLHETGTDADGEPMTDVYAESHDIEIGAGESMAFVRRLIPDWQTLTGTASVSIKAKAEPQATPTVKSRASVSESTRRIDLRARGRSLALRIESSGAGSHFRLGTFRADAVAHGKRV